MKRLILTLTVLLLSPSYIFSQQTVEEVIVTATKTEKTLQEVPIAVSVVTAETIEKSNICLLYTSPSPRDATLSRMPSSA